MGTAVLPQTTKDELKHQFPDVRLYNCYGSTESGRSCILNFNTNDDEPYCIVRPLVNASFIVVDDNRNEIVSSIEHTGLLVCKGRMNMRGYWKQLELTAQTLVDGYIYTNDEAYINPDGRVFLLGRRGDVINYKGIKIAPDEIEEIVMKYGGIADCAVIPETNESAGQIPVLVLKLRTDQFNVHELLHFLADHLDTNKRPRKIIAFDEIPRTYNGKLQRGKLIDLLKQCKKEIVLLHG